MSQLNFEAIGTSWQIDIFQDISVKEEERISSLIHTRIHEFDKTYSRFRDDSLVTQISQQAGKFTFPTDAEDLFAIYYDLYKKTDGLFTPLIGNVISDAGYDASYTLRQKSPLKQPKAWGNILSYAHPTLSTTEPVILDFGAGGKGYLIDLVAAVLQEAHISKYCIDAGGDILYKNNEPIRIGLENPDNSTEMIGVCTLAGGSICGSAGNRRVWEGFTHIINPMTLQSPRNISAVWVVADTAFIADALATCLFFVDAQVFGSEYKFEYCIVYQDHSIQISPGFEAELFTA